MSLNASEFIKTRKIIVIVRGFGKELIADFTDCIHNAGIRVLEFAFDSTGKISDGEIGKLISFVKSRYGDGMSVGAGTVLNEKQLHTAKECGAEFIISPVCDKDIITQTKKLGLVSIPGAFTPTEIVTAHNYGADFVKVFPATVLGPRFFRDMSSPLPHIPLLAVAGITPDNIADYKNAGAVGFGISSPIANVSLAKSGDYDAISAKVREYITALGR